MLSQMNFYWHRQYGPWFILLYATAAIMLAVGVTIPEQTLAYVFLPVGFLIAILASGMHYLTIADDGDTLLIQFGPLPILSRRICYAEIESAERGRTMLLDGWGIHLSLSGGWVWNIWGYDCVVLKLRQGRLQIGSNDADKLLEFVRSKMNSIDTK